MSFPIIPIKAPGAVSSPAPNAFPQPFPLPLPNPSSITTTATLPSSTSSTATVSRSITGTSTTPTTTASTTPSTTPSTTSTSTTPSTTSTSTTSSSTPSSTSRSSTASATTNHITRPVSSSSSSTAAAPSGTGLDDSSTGFFANKPLATGVLTVVGLAVAAILAFAIVTIVRRRRQKRLDAEITAAMYDTHQPTGMYMDDEAPGDRFRPGHSPSASAYSAPARYAAPSSLYRGPNGPYDGIATTPQSGAGFRPYGQEYPPGPPADISRSLSVSTASAPSSASFSSSAGLVGAGAAAGAAAHGSPYQPQRSMSISSGSGTGAQSSSSGGYVPTPYGAPGPYPPPVPIMAQYGAPPGQGYLGAPPVGPGFSAGPAGPGFQGAPMLHPGAPVYPATAGFAGVGAGARQQFMSPPPGAAQRMSPGPRFMSPGPGASPLQPLPPMQVPPMIHAAPQPQQMLQPPMMSATPPPMSGRTPPPMQMQMGSPAVPAVLMPGMAPQTPQWSQPEQRLSSAAFASAQPLPPVPVRKASTGTLRDEQDYTAHLDLKVVNE